MIMTDDKNILFFLMINHSWLGKLQVELVGHSSQELLFWHQLLLLVGLAIAASTELLAALAHLNSYISTPDTSMLFSNMSHEERLDLLLPAAWAL